MVSLAKANVRRRVIAVHARRNENQAKAEARKHTKKKKLSRRFAIFLREVMREIVNCVVVSSSYWTRIANVKIVAARMVYRWTNCSVRLAGMASVSRAH